LLGWRYRLTFLGGYFDSAATSNKTYSATGAAKSVEQPGGFATSSSSSTRVGGLFSFNDTEVISRVGISWISTQKACDNVNNEIPKGTSFASVVDDAVSEWNSEVLSKVTTTNTNETSLSLLYTSLYFMHLIPTNQTGENPGWTSSEPYYQDIFTFWVGHLVQPSTKKEKSRRILI
jgi:putative alpha-1,2-mannosidase